MNNASTTDSPYRLLAPGPVPVPHAVMQAMSGRVLHHRTPQFLQILTEVWDGLKSIFATRQPVMVLTGTGSAAMEAAIVNALSPGDEILVVVSGKFGERWAEMGERFGAQTHRWNVPWGQSLSLDQFVEQLKLHPDCKAVFTQVCETSTATLHPVREMTQLVRQHLPEALMIVDAITAIGCLPLPMDEWGLDVMVAGSQKAFMLPTGLSFIALSERAWRRQAHAQMKRFYFDLEGERKANAKGDSQFSIPTPLIQGLALVLRQLEQRGPDALWKRCQRLSEVTREVAPALGLEVYSQSPSPSVTALKTSVDSAALRDLLEKKHNITIMGGQDQLKGKILRIGHMGDVRDDDMLALFTSLSEELKRSSEWNALRARTFTQLGHVPPLFS